MTPVTPNPAPLSKVRTAHGIVFLAGELPRQVDGTVPEGIEAQTEVTLQRIAATLATLGLHLADVVQATVQLTDPADFPGFNAAWRRHFAEPFPARTTFVAGLFLAGARLEVTVTAALPS